MPSNKQIFPVRGADAGNDLMGRGELSNIWITKTVHVPNLSEESLSRLKHHLKRTLDLEVEWSSRSACLITVEGYEDKVNNAATMQAIRIFDKNAAETRS